MPVIILLGIFGVWGAIDLSNTCSKKAPPHSKREMENMLSQMVGKPKREARKVLRKYKSRNMT